MFRDQIHHYSISWEDGKKCCGLNTLDTLHNLDQKQKEDVREDVILHMTKISLTTASKQLNIKHVL